MPLPVSAQHRLEEVVLYISERTADDPRFGAVKLAKTLYYSDVEAYRDLGEAITGAEYRNWERGPYPPRLGTAKRFLQRTGRVELQETGDYEADRVVPTALQPSNLAAVGVTAEQIAIIDCWIERLRRQSAGKISKDSHEDPGYVAAKRNHKISLDDAAFLAPRPPSAKVVKQAKRLAKARGLLVDGKWQRHPSVDA
jgi:hypothetical protein